MLQDSRLMPFSINGFARKGSDTICMPVCDANQQPEVRSWPLDTARGGATGRAAQTAIVIRLCPSSRARWQRDSGTAQTWNLADDSKCAAAFETQAVKIASRPVRPQMTQGGSTRDALTNQVCICDAITAFRAPPHYRPLVASQTCQEVACQAGSLVEASQWMAAEPGIPILCGDLGQIA